MRVDLGDEILVAGKNDNQYQIGRERQIDQRQDGKNDLFDVILEKMRQRACEFLAESSEQHQERDNQADVERRQEPSRLEDAGLKNFFHACHPARSRESAWIPSRRKSSVQPSRCVACLVCERFPVRFRALLHCDGDVA